MKPLVVSGTDTDVGKTVVAAMLARALNGIYWKPIQSGSPADSERAAELGVREILPEAYRFSAPLSPHRAAALDGVAIDAAKLDLPRVADGRFLIVEGAGGLLVPVTETHLQADLFARWRAPVVLVARTSLGTINHTLLSLEALARRNIPLQGILFCGADEPETIRIIARFSAARILGRLPILDPLDTDTLGAVFAAHFAPADFEPAHD